MGLVDYQMQARDETDQLRLLRRFLSQNPVGLALTIRVQRQVERRFCQKPILEERDVAALSLLSTSLRKELRFEMCKDTVWRFPLFRVWTSVSAAMAQDFSAGCVVFTLSQPNDLIFSAGKYSEHAYFIVNGNMRYIQDPQSSV